HLFLTHSLTYTSSILSLHDALPICRSSLTLIPAKGKTVILLIDGKEKEYYLLSRLQPIKIDVDGPGKLTVMSRLKLPRGTSDVRSEEHTSELQSPDHLVCRLLLEKK